MADTGCPARSFRRRRPLPVPRSTWWSLRATRRPRSSPSSHPSWPRITPASFHIFLVDDNSTDGTAERAGTAENLTILQGRPKPPGWSGKMWAVSQGVAAGTAPLVLLTDADIVHDPRHLSSLVARLLAPAAHAASPEPVSQPELVSEMVRLHCTSLAERILVPAFVYFFQMLYPFSRVNDPAFGGRRGRGRHGARAARGARADRRHRGDQGRAHRRCGPGEGGEIGRGSPLSRTLGPRGFDPPLSSFQRYLADDFAHRVHSTSLLRRHAPAHGARPDARLVGARRGSLRSDPAAQRACGIGACALAAASYLPTLRRYGRSPVGVLALPLIALFYMAATVASALDHWRGAGASWKNRSYGGG